MRMRMMRGVMSTIVVTGVRWVLSCFDWNVSRVMRSRVPLCVRPVHFSSAAPFSAMTIGVSRGICRGGIRMKLFFWRRVVAGSDTVAGRMLWKIVRVGVGRLRGR